MCEVTEEEISQLIEECNEVFNSSFERKISLHQAVSADWLSDTNNCGDESWTDWKKIPNKALIVGSVMFHHFKLEQILFYLPAYMRFSLSLYYKTPMVDTGLCVEMMLRLIGRNYERLESFRLTDNQITFIHKIIKLNLKEEAYRDYLCEDEEILEEKYRELI